MHPVKQSAVAPSHHQANNLEGVQDRQACSERMTAIPAAFHAGCNGCLLGSLHSPGLAAGYQQPDLALALQVEAHLLLLCSPLHQQQSGFKFASMQLCCNPILQTSSTVSNAGWLGSLIETQPTACVRWPAGPACRAEKVSAWLGRKQDPVDSTPCETSMHHCPTRPKGPEASSRQQCQCGCHASIFTGKLTLVCCSHERKLRFSRLWATALATQVDDKTVA